MTYFYESDLSELRSSIRAEVEFPGEVRKGKKGIIARRLQEWLYLHGHKLSVDADFGNVTEHCLLEFQRAKNLHATGTVDHETWTTLVAPMLRVLKAPKTHPNDFSAALVSCGKRHLSVHPVEVGGSNMGPWVRLYMSGKHGNDQKWCAGFVTFLLNQASQLTGQEKPVKGSVSCDNLAKQAQNAGLFVSEKALRKQDLQPGAIFLTRSKPTDWNHTGLVVEASDDYFVTIEGNSNELSSGPSYEACSRKLGYRKRDFIIQK